MKSHGFEWTPEKLHYMKDAFEQVQYQKQLAQRASHYITERDSVCDVGCGLGYLALALTGFCRKVTALDISRPALDILWEQLRKSPNRAVEIREEDFHWMPEDEIYDSTVFCFTGSIPEILQTAASHCRGNVILFRKNWPYHRLSRKSIPLSELIFLKDCEELSSYGIPFQTEQFTIDMGQPLRSLEDACRYFELYRKKEDTGCITEREAADLLETTGQPFLSEEFPYYYPMNHEIGMIIIRAEDIRQAACQSGDWTKERSEETIIRETG